MSIFIIILVFIVIAAGLARFFIIRDHGEKEPVGALWMAFGFGFGGGIIAAVIEDIFIPLKDLSSAMPLTTILTAALAIGLIEESCKFIPLALFLYPKRYFNEHTDGIIYFAIAGLGFGLPENILYTIEYGSGTGLNRIFLTPIFHATTTAMVGYFLVKAKLAHRRKRMRLLLTFLVLIIAMVLHGLYDFGLSTGEPLYTYGSVVITLSLSITLFLLYFRATELDQRLGLSAVGHNKFCRNCGHANPSRNLYCAHCGKRA
jgi:RsiW-degrading membrane proteinase PrsW (M82 family)